MIKKIFTHKLFIPFTILVVFPLSLVVSKIVFATTPVVTEYALPNPITHPFEIVNGPDGNLWFSENDLNKIGKINPCTGAVTEYSLPQIGISPRYLNVSGVVTGPDGNIWFTTNQYRIGKMTTSGAVTLYNLPSKYWGIIGDITVGPDKNIWFTGYSSNLIGVMNTGGTLIKEYSVPGGVEGISTGPDGNIWFAQQNLNLIGKINISTGAISSYPVSYASYVTAPGPDGNVWFSSGWGYKIGNVNPSTGVVSEYSLPSKIGYGPHHITAGPDGNMWFTLQAATVGMINVSTKAITFYNTPNSPVGGSFAMVTGLDKNVWYTVANNYSRLGKINIGLSGSYCGVPSSGTGSTGTGSSGTGTGSNGAGTGTGTGSTGTGSSGTGSGDNSSTDPKDAKEKVIVIIQHDGTTKATVATGIKLDHKNYAVPEGQVLYVDGSLGIVQVRNGASIKGSGKVNGLTVDQGAILAPGHSPGCLDSGNLSMLGTYQVEIAGVDSCKSYDQLKVIGSVYLNGMLDINWLDNFKPKVGQSFVIINNDGNDSVNGQFIGLGEGHVFEILGVSYSVSYKGGDGNDVVLSVAGVASAKAEKLHSKIFKNVGAFTSRNIAVLVSLVFVTVLVAISVVLRVRTVEKNNAKPKKYLKKLANKSKRSK